VGQLRQGSSGARKDTAQLPLTTFNLGRPHFLLRQVFRAIVDVMVDVREVSAVSW
jgi:hypothetical protein